MTPPKDRPGMGPIEVITSVQRRRRYRKPENDALLPLIREVANARPTYGYPRITVLLNKRLAELG